jgi:hypothetical protein
MTTGESETAASVFVNILESKYPKEDAQKTSKTVIK